MNESKPLSPVIPTLLKRYKRFRRVHFEANNTFEPLVQHGQKPRVLIISCCDSRMAPALILGCEPGELFVVRNVANLVPTFEQSFQHPSVAAALEFAVVGLGVTDIIVLGHTHCGGIQTLMDPSSAANDFIHLWLRLAEPAKDYVLKHHGGCSLEEQISFCEKHSIVNSMKHLETFPWVKERMEAGRLSVHGWLFDLGTGYIESYDVERQAFACLE